LAYVQTPYTELPFDVWKRQELVIEGDHTLDDVCGVKFMVRFGRPLCVHITQNSCYKCLQLRSSLASGGLFGKAGDKVVQDGIIQLAMDKLAACKVGKYEANSFLAALSVRLMLDFESRRMRATEVENLIVAGHLRVANVIPAHCGYLVSSTPSELIVAEAAAQLLRRQNMLRM
jgi:hypothetical protein